jgi:hypothetical protein
MKKIIIALTIIIFYNCSTSKNTESKKFVIENEKVVVGDGKTVIYDYADKINSEQLNFIKKTYNWKNEKILIIDYVQPISISTCNINYSKIPDSGKKWRKEFYSKINTEDCLKIQIFSNGEKLKKRLDNIIYFDDKNDFLFDIFFSRRKSCFGVLVLNNEGYYIQHNGHTSENQVSKFIENLKK